MTAPMALRRQMARGAGREAKGWADVRRRNGGGVGVGTRSRCIAAGWSLNRLAARRLQAGASQPSPRTKAGVLMWPQFPCPGLATAPARLANPRAPDGWRRDQSLLWAGVHVRAWIHTHAHAQAHAGLSVSVSACKGRRCAMPVHKAHWLFFPGTASQLHCREEAFLCLPSSVSEAAGPGVSGKAATQSVRNQVRRPEAWPWLAEGPSRGAR